MSLALFVRCGEQTLPIEVSHLGSVGDVIDALTSAGVDLMSKDLMFSGQVLDPFQTLADAGVGAQAVLELAEREVGQPAAVFTLGSSWLRYGMAGDRQPAVEHACIGQLKQNPTPSGPGHHVQSKFVGDDGWSRQSNCILRFPVERGYVSNWDGFEDLISHCYQRLHQRRGTGTLDEFTTSIPAVLTTQGVIPAHLERMSQIMFETFNVPSFELQPNAVMALTACGRNEGAVLECGATHAQLSVVSEGKVCVPSRGLTFCGQDAADGLLRLVRQKLGGTALTGRDAHVAADTLVREHCYVAPSRNGDPECEPCSVRLPDGTEVTLKEERYKALEEFFSPGEGTEYGHGVGIVDYTADGLSKSKVQGIGTVCLAGGCTLYRGFADRFRADLSIKVPGSQVIARPDRRHLVWRGASMLPSLPQFTPWALADYDEYGPGLVHQRFPLHR
eukprot:TRINITY_DN10048_c0_g1_i1.p1 TRINITY_DN10048_c0_g1~~TRINITY_DN10048_c0_g1_i1.p1  ORF type:complete len:469 (+),score=57.77 TRINITY_DN10048_c0_g1_i1:72-1409(+)